MALVLILLALVWAGFVLAAVIGSAASGGATIVAFDRELLTPGTPEGVWILCGLALSAGLTLAWAFGAWTRRRHQTRLSAELDARWAERSHEATADEARGRLLESRERELDDMVHTLTAQRDALLGEITVLRTTTPSVVKVPEADDAGAERTADRAG